MQDVKHFYCQRVRDVASKRVLPQINVVITAWVKACCVCVCERACACVSAPHASANIAPQTVSSVVTVAFLHSCRAGCIESFPHPSIYSKSSESVPRVLLFTHATCIFPSTARKGDDCARGSMEKHGWQLVATCTFPSIANHRPSGRDFLD